MILTDRKILDEMKKGTIIIEPFDQECLGTNSYDIHLSKYFAQYTDLILDAKKHNQVRHFEITDKGHLLQPGELYLASTVEYTETHAHIPYVEGKSSTGRLGIDIHATAGKGDIGFCNHWTLEISTRIPVLVYPGMPIGQLIYFVASGAVKTPYNKKKTAKYGERNPKPKESMMFLNFAQ